MSIPRVTRAEFSAAVEAGVTAALAAGVIDFPEAAELRRFGREHVGLVATGAYYVPEYNCGCPLWETGLHRPAGFGGHLTTESRLRRERGSRPRTGARFTTPYDCRIPREVAGDGEDVYSPDDNVVEVVA
jgi:hypothetical protein